ncbi:MAG: hypothetical protein HETSPECPRED_007507 [Heterodermia speciosa]|uniref:Uncharacterized protein n=1 Tax=Heterodermia speciosa TaxID=116794 RepID=A0A8H3FU11_9LECA|nr:MAG: hypothetical protein HETSPECPRED_007507 [Heterodermia speciosa]
MSPQQQQPPVKAPAASGKPKPDYQGQYPRDEPPPAKIQDKPPRWGYNPKWEDEAAHRDHVIGNPISRR